MSFRGIYAITSDALLADKNYLDRIKQALDGGIAMLQYRSKALPMDSRLLQAEQIRQCCDDFGVPLIVNDELSLLRSAGAAGIHLGQEDQPASEARRELPEAIVGVSCHDSIKLAVSAETAGANYVAFGRFFASHSKPQAPPATLATLADAKVRLNIPIVAIGGINPENGASLVAAGADMLAVIDAIFGTDQSYENTRSLVNLFEQQ